MALGAYQSQSVSAAQARARLTGQAVPVTVNGVTMIAYPNGNLGGYNARGGTVNALAPQTVVPSTPASNVAGVAGSVGSPSGPAASTGPFGITSPTVQQPTVSMAPAAAPAVSTSQPAVDDYGRVIPTINVTAPSLSSLTAPNSGVNLGLNIGTPVPDATTQAQGTLNRANPNTTYVSPNTAQPAGAVPVTGQTDTQSGPAVHATYNMPPAPTLAAQAKNYRAQHGLSDDAETEALNTESLAAARAGRTSLDPTLAAQYGQAPAAGTYGPRTDVVNALTAPQTSGQPIMLAPTTTATASAPAAAARYDWPANMQAQNLLQQGVY